MALVISTWFWGSKYPRHYLYRLAASVARNLKREHHFCVFRPLEEDQHLTEIPGCFARLRMFDPEWQRLHGIKPGDRIVNIDVDCVITGSLDPLFDRDEDFVIMQGGNAANPCPFNGALTMIRAGAHPEVWTDFSLDAARAAPFYEFPDDQGWIWHKLPKAAGWKCGPESGVYVFAKTAWGDGEELPSGARLVAFAGKRSPERFSHLPWIKEHWRTG